GCLFDRRLCSPQEVCVQDGLFGQCQVGSVQDRPYFQVTSHVLQRLQDVLRHLMAQGLSWQDGITQYVISQEMERIPRLRPSPPLEPMARDRALGVTSPDLGESPCCCLPPRFLPLRSSPRRAPLTTDPGLPAAQHLGQPPPLLPSPMVQRYLEHVLLPPSPQLGYEEAVLNPYSYHRFGYQNGAHQLSSSSARQSPETSSLLGRVPAQAFFGAGPVPSYGGQPGTDGGHLFQDLGMLSLPREKAGHSDPASTRLQHSLRLSGDYRDTEEREQTAPLAAQPPPAQTDAAMKRLASLLASYGLGLPELSPQQLSSLSTLLQLLQSSAPPFSSLQMSEGDMQHREEPVRPTSTVPRPKIPNGSSLGDGLRDRAMSLPPPHAEPQQGLGGSALSPGKPTVVKKSYTEENGSGAQRGTRPPDEYGYIITDQKPLGLAAGVQLLELLAKHLHLSTASFINISVVGPALTFRIQQNPQNLSLADVANQAEYVKAKLEAELGLKVIQTGVGERNEAAAYSRPSHFGDGFHSVLLTFIALACVAGIAIAAAAAFCLRRHAKQREKERLAALGPEGAADTTFEYQELCRQHMAAKSFFGRAESSAAPAETSRVSSVSSQFSDAPQPSPSSHSSTPSWCEEPVQSNMDISTGHMILAYMEDHLRNRDRLAKEWQALCAYQAEPSICSIAQSEANLKKNRNPDYVPYDHVRIRMKAESNPSRSDFINASPIIEHDPRMPAYIATQGPLSHTIADFWQMVWEHGCTVIVMLSPLAEDSVKQCDRYWPDEGSSLYHIYEASRTGTYILVDMVLNRMAKGVKEIDIAATLEHIRDQRPGMVQTKDQFEFALTAVAEEVNAILKALPQ
ncbi:PTPRN protein, partial [Oreotrochilus melanogaster]|nr:PTPRN protein [Oreotrochilus melanogaster]